MWFDTIFMAGCVVAFIVVEAATTALVSVLVCGGRCRGHAGQLFLMSALAGRCLFSPLYRPLRSA